MRPHDTASSQVEELGAKILDVCTDQQLDVVLVTLARLMGFLIADDNIDYAERMIILNSLFIDIASELKQELQ